MKNDISPPAIVSEETDLAALARKINAEPQAAGGTVRSSLEHARAAGVALLQAKKACGHGQWLKWLKANVRCSERHARNYMQFAKSAVTADLDEQQAAWQRIQGNATEEEEEEPPIPPSPVPPAIPSPPEPAPVPPPAASPIPPWTLPEPVRLMFEARRAALGLPPLAAMPTSSPPAT